IWHTGFVVSSRSGHDITELGPCPKSEAVFFWPPLMLVPRVSNAKGHLQPTTIGFGRDKSSEQRRMPHLGSDDPACPYNRYPKDSSEGQRSRRALFVSHLVAIEGMCCCGPVGTKSQGGRLDLSYASFQGFHDNPETRLADRQIHLARPTGDAGS